jgi:3-deoxy-7-phosphoheptulonate synthase
LHGGPCTASPAVGGELALQEALRVLKRTGAVLSHGAALPVVVVGRLAARPAGAAATQRGPDVGDGPHPGQMVHAYADAAAAMNLVRATAGNGLEDLCDNMRRIRTGPVRHSCRICEVVRAAEFIKSIGASRTPGRARALIEMFAVREADVLDYERALLRGEADASRSQLFSSGAHLVWLGRRVRRVNGHRWGWPGCWPIRSGSSSTPRSPRNKWWTSSTSWIRTANPVG